MCRDRLCCFEVELKGFEAEQNREKSRGS